MKKSLFILFLCIGVLGSVRVHAEPQFALRLQSMGQIYREVGGDARFPFSTYGHLYLFEPKYTSDLTLDFRYALDPAGEDHRFDLYRGVVELSTGEDSPVIDLGRMQLVEGIDYLLLDGVKINGRVAQDHLEWSLFGGWTRGTEIGVDRDAGMITGVRLSALQIWKLRNRFTFLYEDYESGAQGNRLSFSLGRDFHWLRDFALDAGMEFSLVKNDFSRLFFTQDVHLNEAISAHMSYYYRNPLQNELVERDPIYRTFAAGGTHQFRPSLSFFIGEMVVFEPSYELSRYRALNGVKRNSHRIEAALYLLPNRLRVHARATASYWKVLRGRNWIGTFSLGKWLTPRTDFSVGGELAYYEKYTNEEALASRGYIEFGFLARHQLKFSGTVEAISNEDKEMDIRFMFFLQALIGSET